MYSKDEIIARLAKGEDAQAIADEIAATLNGALAEHLANQEKQKKESQKAKDARHVLEVGFNFIATYYPDLADDNADDLSDFSDEDIIEIADNVADEIRALEKAKKKVDGIIDEILAGWDLDPEKVEIKKVEVKEGDPIADFLAKYVNS